jgi:hypothetical protein
MVGWGVGDTRGSGWKRAHSEPRTAVLKNDQSTHLTLLPFGSLNSVRLSSEVDARAVWYAHHPRSPVDRFPLTPASGTLLRGHTVLLPKTDFEMRANSVAKEPMIQQYWADNKVGLVM